MRARGLSGRWPRPSLTSTPSWTSIPTNPNIRRYVVPSVVLGVLRSSIASIPKARRTRRRIVCRPRNGKIRRGKQGLLRSHQEPRRVLWTGRRLQQPGPVPETLRRTRTNPGGRDGSDRRFFGATGASSLEEAHLATIVARTSYEPLRLATLSERREI